MITSTLQQDDERRTFIAVNVTRSSARSFPIVQYPPLLTVTSRVAVGDANPVKVCYVHNTPAVTSYWTQRE